MTSQTTPIAAADRGERELKFTLPEARAHLGRRWLETHARRDPRFPSALVWTLYYDTPGWRSLGEKLNSEYLKRKIRVRWYSGAGDAPAGPVFLEAKMRVGTHRRKERLVLPYPAEALAEWPIQDPRLRQLPALLRGRGLPVDGAWEPVIGLRYRRDRFVEPLSGARVSLDTEIVATALNSRVLAGSDGSPLGVAVVEVKGAADQLPRALHVLLPLGLRKRSFSKFLAVYAHATRTTL